MKTKQRLVLLDSHAIIHRAYHALPDFKNSKGFPTGALFGLVTMILRIVTDLKPDFLVATFDLPEKTFRHHIFDNYKGTRKKTDDQLVEQIKRAEEVVSAFGIPTYKLAGFEADDVLGTIVALTKNIKDLEVVIASGDMDTMQLIEGDRVKVFTLKKSLKDVVLYDEGAVVEKYGFSPSLIIDYKALRGDPSDNIPGVKGIGEKSAKELLLKYGTIESIYDSFEKKGIEGFLADGISKRTCNLLPGTREEAEFSKILATIKKDVDIDFKLPMNSWPSELDLELLEKLFKEFEFRSLWERVRGLLEVNIDDSKEKQLDEKSLSVEQVKEVTTLLWLINSELTNPTIRDVWHFTNKNTYKDALGFLLEKAKEDGVLLTYQEIEKPIFGLVEEMSRNGVKLDLDYLRSLSAEYHNELLKLQTEIYQMAGVEFNIKSPKQLGEVLFGNLGLSTKGIKKTPAGEISTKESELEKLIGKHPVVDKIFEYRELQKLLSTYIDNLPNMTDESDRLHPEFLQSGTSTGRFSSVNPNIQNIPIRTESGLRVRQAFVAEAGYQLVAFDYSQIELRVLAIMSKDPYLIRVFNEGIDVHTAVASKVFGIPVGDVTPEQRAKAKTINFGIIYGMGVNALAKQLNVSRGEAQDFHNKYLAQFSNVESFFNKTKLEALQNGYTTTLFGRRRYFPLISSRLPYQRAQAERMAINAPIQGTATADIIKLAMRYVNEKVLKAGFSNQAKLIMQVHDELIFEVKKELVKEFVDKVKLEMESVLANSFLKINSPVPLQVSVGFGDNWAETK